MEMSGEGENAVWHVHVSELIGLFQEALQVLAPVMVRAQIQYTEDTAYDDWDNIAQCLYENMVCRSIRFATEIDETIDLPAYAMLYETYSHTALVQMEDLSKPAAGPFAFHSFVTRKHPFDTAVGIQLRDDYKTATSVRHEAGFDRVQFKLVLRDRTETRTISELDIVL
jgi:hypothetical protein